MSDWPRVNRSNADDLRRLGRMVDTYKSRQKPVPTNGEWQHYDWTEDFFADARAGGWTDEETHKNLAALHQQQALDDLTQPGTEFVSRGGD